MEKIVFSTNSARKTEYSCKKMNVNSLLTSYTKINSKCIINRNLRPNSIKFLEELTVYLYDTGLSNGFLDTTQKHKWRRQNQKN